MKACIVGLALLVGAQSAPSIRSDQLTPADLALIVSRIPRVAIDRFSALPPTVRDTFIQMNCRVPQNTTTAPSNVIQGEFAAKGQRDWAALCSDGTTSQIRIVWGGSARCGDRVASTQDADTLIATAPNVHAYSRAIATAPPAQVERFLVKYGATLPAAPGHDAIEDVVDRVRTLRYCAAGQWLSVP